MITNTEKRAVVTGGVADSTMFGISAKDGTHIMSILRDTLYSDKILAVMREYSANAFDAHREAGKATTPIHITMPTMRNSNFVVRDYGKGLSHDDVWRIFTQYGASTKRDTNEQVGSFGIGCKSGFAYSDTFTVTSWHDGMQRIYVAVLDASNAGEMKLLSEAPCGANETGVEISIPVKPEDHHQFNRRAVDLFKYFNPRPLINIDLPALAEVNNLTNGDIYAGRGEWVAVMGCIPYKLDLYQLSGMPQYNRKFMDRANVHGVLNFNIGEVHVSASRESLKYSDFTKIAMIKKINALVDEYVAMVLAKVKDNSLTNWQRRLSSQVLYTLGLVDAIGNLDREWTSRHVSLVGDHDTFRLSQNGSGVYSIYVHDTTRFVVRDDKRNIKGFDLRDYDVLVTPNEGFELDQVRAQLDTVITASKMDGVEVINLSEVEWNAPLVAPRRKSNVNPAQAKKYFSKRFQFEPVGTEAVYPYSRDWQVATTEPATTDVYVVFEEFMATSTTGGTDFFHQYQNAKKVATAFGLEFPVVYGYKSTPKKPVAPAAELGMTWNDWYSAFRKTVKALPNLGVTLTSEMWARIANQTEFDYDTYTHGGDLTDKTLAALKTELGDKHIIVEFADKCFAAAKNPVDTELVHATLQVLRSDDSGKITANYSPEVWLSTLHELYPLVKLAGGIRKLWAKKAEDRGPFVDYVKMVDSK